LKSGGGVCISGDRLLISCRSLAIRALDGSTACVGVPLKKAAAQLPTGLRLIGRAAATAPAPLPPTAAATAPAPLPVAAAGGRLVDCALCGRCGIGCERPALSAVGRAELGRDMLLIIPETVVTTVSMPFACATKLSGLALLNATG